MVRLAQLAMMGCIAGSVAAYYLASTTYGGDREVMIRRFHDYTRSLGIWAMPVYIATHTLAIAMCFPYAVAFEAGAAFLFGFLNGVLCVFSAKVLGAALAFGIGRILFRSSPAACNFVRNNKYFSVLNKGVARDGWKFVLLARFSPVPSYIINYGLAATDVHFFVDFLLPTLAGGIPMILQNTSLGTLTSAATTGRGSKKPILSFILPCLGILSGILISWRIKKYASQDFDVEEKVVEGSKGSQAEGLQTEVTATPVPTSGDGKLHQRRKH
ncbi:unnamed protein product [Calypogeia fissa]